MNIFIDTETTGLCHQSDEVLEISIINENGDILLDTLVKPTHKTEWPEAQAIHGITPEMIRGNNAPTLKSLAPTIASIIHEADQVVAYNVAYDKPFIEDAGILSDFNDQTPWFCAMEAFAEVYGVWDQYRNQYKWQKLTKAAEHVGHKWQGEAHRSLADCQATLSIWKWLQYHLCHARLVPQLTK